MSLTDTKATSMTGSDCLNSCFNTADKIINNLHENLRNFSQWILLKLALNTNQSINHDGYIQNHATPSYKYVDNMNQDFTLEWASK
jgi:hypothetical protein